MSLAGVTFKLAIEQLSSVTVGQQSLMEEASRGGERAKIYSLPQSLPNTDVKVQ